MLICDAVHLAPCKVGGNVPFFSRGTNRGDGQRNSPKDGLLKLWLMVSKSGINCLHVWLFFFFFFFNYNHFRERLCRTEKISKVHSWKQNSVSGDQEIALRRREFKLRCWVQLSLGAPAYIRPTYPQTHRCEKSVLLQGTEIENCLLHSLIYS